MISQQTLRGSWNEIAGKLRSKWGELSDDELERHHGNLQELVGYIQRKTGVARDQIERFLNDLGTDGSGAMGRAAGAAQYAASRAAESARRGAHMVAQGAQSGYAAAERMVHRRPATSVATAFGAGLITGIVLAILLRSDD
jgi:uncharacterized protein YjbJ (UPF0337 family)